MTFADMVAAELARATANNGPFHSMHEGYAVLQEEVDELWEEVKKKPANRDKKNMLTECVQIAAMAQRFALDCCLMPLQMVPMSDPVFTWDPITSEHWPGSWPALSPQSPMLGGSE